MTNAEGRIIHLEQQQRKLEALISTMRSEIAAAQQASADWTAKSISGGWWRQSL